jgi:signal transduction histidine kinase
MDSATLGSSDFLSGGGEMAELIRSTDWSKTPLGPIEAWPQSLRTTVSLALASNFPINIIWGPGHSQIYNDGYRVMCGAAHPKALGEGYHETWASAWPEIGPPFEQALAGGRSFLENQRMFLFRNGYLEETFFTFSLSPIRDESGGVGGVFLPVIETTPTILADRRTRLLRDLNARLADARTAGAVFAAAIEIAGDHPFDLPFVLLYELDADAGAYRLAGHLGIDAGAPAAAPSLPLDAAAPWPVERLLGARDPVRIELGEVLPPGTPCGPYDEPPSTALGFALAASNSTPPSALLMVGVSPRLPLDDDYGGFCSLLAAAVSAGLANARAYEEERQRAEALAALDRTKTAFFSNVSHEFRTPLTLMLGPIEDALAGAEDLPPVLREQLDVAHRNALRLLKLVNSLLDFSRIEAGRTRASFEPTDLAALTAGLASSFDSACARAGLALVIDCPPLPEPVFVDRDLWEKVVLNLVSNAFKFTLEGQITVSLRAQARQVELVVSDTGVGIDEVELPRVFERFHRIEGQKGRTYEGTGIGLALVDELVRLHGGAIRAESREGQGSAFHVTIPLGAAHLPREHISMERSLASTEGRDSAFVAEALRWLPDHDRVRGETVEPRETELDESRPRILLADDNADMRAYVRRLLEDGGYQVEAVENGRAALDAIRRGPPPDLLLSDVMMPELDGFGLLSAVRADPDLEGVLVILLSARAGEEARVEGLAAGADDYLVKPFGARELQARVDGAVRLARQRRESAHRERDLLAEIAVERGKSALRQSEQQLEFALQAGRMGSWELDIVSGRLATSEYCRTIFGLVPGDPFERYEDIIARVHPDDKKKRQDAVDHAIATGADLEVEHRILMPDGSIGWVLTRGRAAYEKGRAVRAAGVSLDITARKTAENHQRLLLDELNHRVKNTLSTVQSIAMQTRGSDARPSRFDVVFLARIEALARAHDLLTEASWEGASLGEVMGRTLAFHVSGGEAARVRLSGPPIQLSPNAAVTLNLAFHELATNAVKYGSLSTSAGRVDVDWKIDDATSPSAVVIEWRESGGPEVSTPTRRGFGSRLIERGLAHEFSGECELRFRPEGLHCRIRLPLSAKLKAAA